MKKLFITLLMGAMFLPSQMLAKHHEFKQLSSYPSIPVMAPARYRVAFNLDYETGLMTICPNYDIAGLNISLVGSDGVTYLNTTVSLTAGQEYSDSLDFLEEGTYILTLSTANGVIRQYEITVTDD